MSCQFESDHEDNRSKSIYKNRYMVREVIHISGVIPYEFILLELKIYIEKRVIIIDYMIP